MKRLINISSVLMLVAMLGITGSRTYAAHQSASMLRVRLCSSAPIGVPALHDLARGIFNGVELASGQWRAKMAKKNIDLLPPLLLDDARSDGVTYDTNHERQNALTCIARTDTYGYIGTLNSGAALVSEPITNKAGMVMISPANTSPTLTAPSGRAAQEPLTYNHRLHYVTYYRTVTTDNLQGPAGAAFMHTQLRVKTYALVDDKTTYGAGLAATMDSYARKHYGMQRTVGPLHIDNTSAASITESSNAIADQIVARKPDAVYCGCDSENAYALPRQLREKGYTGPFVGGDALYNTAWITKTGSGSISNYATSVGPPPQSAKKTFLQLYQKHFKAFYKSPGPQAYDALSFDASNILLNAIYESAVAGKLQGLGTMFARRSVVLKYVSETRWPGVTGITTFDHNGDTTNRVISIYAVRGSSWKYIARAPRLPGITPT